MAHASSEADKELRANAEQRALQAEAAEERTAELMRKLRAERDIFEKELREVRGLAWTRRDEARPELPSAYLTS